VRPIFWRRLLPVKFLGGILAISSNMVVGREGPTIQIGGNIGEMLGTWFGLTRHRRDTLIAAGAAAGLAVAFSAPLAGVLFVIEEMRKPFQFSFTNFSVVAIACVSATIVGQILLGQAPAIKMDIFELPSYSSLGWFVLFGIVVGLVGLVFNRALICSLNFADRLNLWTRVIFVLGLGAFVGWMTVVEPTIVGGGYDIIEQALYSRPSLIVLGVIFVLRFIIGMLCYGTGVPGGIFAPMLALGTLLGLTCSYVLRWSMDPSLHPGMFAVAGMGALFSACVRAPLTGIVLVVEMTQNYSLILPLMVTCLTSTTIVQCFANPPIYTQLLKRVLSVKK
jgi:CIC family chloride channel protein